MFNYVVNARVFLWFILLFSQMSMAVDLDLSLDTNPSEFEPGSSQSNAYVFTISKPDGSDDVSSIQITASFSGSSDSISTMTWACAATGDSDCNSNGTSTNNESFTAGFDLEGDGNDVVISLTNVTFNSDIFDDLTFDVEITDFGDSEGSSNSDGNNNNDSESVDLERESETDISISVTDSSTQYTPGETANYTITVTNDGPSDASGVSVTDGTLPAGFNIDSWTCSSSCTPAAGGSNVSTSVDIAAGDSAEIVVVGNYDSGALISPLVYFVEADITDSDATDPNGSPATDSDSNTIKLVSQLLVTLSDGETTYVPGDVGQFTATVTNDGPSDVIGATVVDSNLTEAENISWTCSVTDAGSSCPTGPETTPINTTVDLVAGDSAVFTIDINYLSNATTNPLVYEITATNPDGVEDTIPVVGTDNNNVLRREVNLSLTKESKVGSFVPNEPFIYTITLANAGPSDLGSPGSAGTPDENALQLTDLINTTLADHPSECNSVNNEPCWKYCPSDNGVNNSSISPDNCPNFANLATDSGYDLDIGMHLSAGSSSEIRVYARVTQTTGIGADSDCDSATGASREVCNTVEAQITDSNTFNVGTQSPLSDFVSNEIIVGTDIVVTKTDGLTSASPGSEIEYEIVVRNDGFTGADKIAVSDVLPMITNHQAGFETGSVSWVCETNDANACCVSETTSCGLNSPVIGATGDELNATIDLGGQSEVKFTVVATISNLASGTISNSATATLPAGITETDLSNNTGTDDDTVLGEESDISVLKTLINDQLNDTDSTVTDLEYSVVVTNNGPSYAQGIQVVDLLNRPNMDISSASWTCSVQGSGTCYDAGPVDGMSINSTVDLAVNSTATFNVNVSTNPFSEGSVVNIVSVTSGGLDPVSINNTSSVEFALTGQSQLRIDNDDGLTEATPGNPTSYTIRVENEGPDNVFGARVENIFPPQLTDVQWTCNAISPIPGELTPFQESDQSAAGNRMLISPDGSHIYVASPDLDGLAPYESKLYVFQRNTLPGATYGQFYLVESITQGDAGITGLESIQEMQMSQNGAYLYVYSDELSATESAVTVFIRNNNQLSPDFGRLTFLESIIDETPVVPVDMVLTADQNHIYITGDDEIIRYKRDTGTGQLTFEETINTSVAGYLSASADSENLYVADVAGNQVDAYSRINIEVDPDFGDLMKIGDVIHTDIDVVSDMIISGNDRNLYLAATGTDKLVVINRDISANGVISHAASYDDMALLFNPTETLVGMKHLSLSPDGEHLFVSNPAASDPNDGSLLILSRNSQGLLSKSENPKISLEGMEGLSDAVVTPDKKQVLTTATDGKTLIAFDRRQPDPTFSFIEAEIDQVNDPNDPAGIVDGILGAAAVVVSSDGAHVYAAGIGDNAIAVFNRNRDKGSTSATAAEHLTFNSSYHDGEQGITGLTDVNSLAISPNGKFIYAGSRDESTLAVFSRAADGTLAFVESHVYQAGQVRGLLGISAIVVNNNTQSLYVAGQFEASVAHYSINSVTGELFFEGVVANGDFGVSGLAGARSLALSAPDERHLLVASGIDDSVVVLNRSLANGEIEFMQHLTGVGDQPMDIAVSNDGNHIYVASSNDSRLTVINRSKNAADFGFLTVNTSYIDNVGGFNHLQGLRSVVVSPDGEKVYVGAEFDAAISVLDRDTNPNSASFGRLSVVETQVDNVDGVNGLNQLYDLAVSNDSKHVYAAGFGDNALAAFVLGTGSSCSAQGSGNISDIVDIGTNGTLTYTVNGLIRSNAINDIITEARILPPENFTVLNPLDNCAEPTASDDDNCDVDVTALVPITDLSISKSDGQLSAIAGNPITYEIRVSNAGPSDANSSALERVMVKDILLTGMPDDDFTAGSVSWTCEAVGSGSLQFVSAVINGVEDEAGNLIQGLNGLSSVAYADNLAGLGPHVLATSVIDNGLLAFSFNEMNGQLTQVFQSGSYVTATNDISLKGARDVLVIGNDVYVASQVDDALVTFKAMDNSGLTLQWVDNQQVPAISTGLNQAVSVSASDDGAHVYVTGANDDSVVIFSRNLGTGQLTYYGVVSAVNQGLNGVNTLAVSGDGHSVYTSGYNNNELGVYRRDLISGDLTFVSTINDPGVVFNAVSSVTISPDDKHVYVSNAGNHRVYVFARETSVDPSSADYGSLTAIQTIEQGVDGVGGLLMPSKVMVSEDDRHVYVSSEQSDAVAWFARNTLTGELVFGGLISDLISSVDGLNGALDLAADDIGKYVFVAGSQDKGIAVLTRSADSHCPASGVGNVSVIENGIELGVPVDLAVNGQLIFKVNATVASDATGSITNQARVLSCPLPLNGSEDEFCLNSSDTKPANNLATDVDILNPTADLMITKTDGVSIYEGLTGATQVTGDDQYLYVAAAQDNAISMFERETNINEPENYGLLTYIGEKKNGVNGVSGLLAVSDVVLSSDGQTLYASGSGDNSIVVFSKAINGQLNFVEKQTSGVFAVTGIEGVSSLSLSADGAHLYATGPLTNSLAVFKVDQSGGIDHGKLTFVQKLQNAVDGVAGLANASSVLVSNDGMHVYVTSESGHSVALFLRNPNETSVSYGELSYQTTYINGVDGLAGLMGAKKMVMDSDDEFLYILGAIDQALVVFGRDVSTGELNFVEFKQNGTSDVVGLNLARDLILSDDQQSLYVAGGGENALVRFIRDDVAGTLAFADVINDADPLSQPGTTIDGLSGAAGLYISGNDEFVYVVADQDHSVSVYNRDLISPSPEFGALSLKDVLINGRGGVAPGSELTYLITVSNAGPSDAVGARVVDVFPPQFENISSQCFPINNAGCVTAPQQGNVNLLVNLPVGSSVEIQATGIVRSDAEGVISNTATVTSSTDPLLAVSDPNIANNTATDDDTVLFVASDLKIVKDNATTESIPGDLVSYNIIVSNDATLTGNGVPADVSDVSITDVVPEAISNVSWTCEAFPLAGLLDDGDGDPGTDAYLSYTDLISFNDMVIDNSGEIAIALGEDAGVSTLVVYQRDTRTGDLTAIQRINESNFASSGLAGAQAMALSPNNSQLYVVSNTDDSISVWSIDQITGELSFEDVLTDGLSGVNGLGGAHDVLVTDDGLHVYVAGKSDNAIAIFNRNIGTGLLTFNSFIAGVEGLAGVHALTQAGNYLLVVAEDNQSVASFTRTVQNGLLTSADVIQDFELSGSVLDMPRDVVYSNNNVLVASYGSDALAIFSLDSEDGMLNFKTSINHGDADVTDLEGPEGILISSSGDELYVASSVSSAIMLFNYDGDSYQPASTVYDSSLINDLDGVNQLVRNQSGTHLYALSDELVLATIQNGSSCTESGQGSLNDMADIVSMGHVNYTLTGTVLPTATGVLRNTATALLNGESVELNPTDNFDFDEDILVPTSDLSITKDDGLTQVVAGTSLQYDISVFSAGPSAMNVIVEDDLPIYPAVTAGFSTQQTQWSCNTGRTLQANGNYLGDTNNGLESGRDVFESPDGQFVYVISDLGTLSVFSKDSSGILSLVQLVNDGDELNGEVVVGLVGAKAATMDSQGKNIYVVSQSANQLMILSRNEATGMVDYQRTITSGDNNIFGMLGPIEVVVSPDDKGVYVAAYESDAITVFERDQLDGDLTFIERVKDGFGTIVPESNVIIEITDLVISADGQYLYAAADFSEAITVFSRNVDSQVLTFQSVIRAGDDHNGITVPVMDGSQTLVITNNGDYVYALVEDSSSLLRFKRNDIDGSLQFEAEMTHGDSGVGSLQAPNTMTLTPDGGRLLVTDVLNNFISIYDRNTTTGVLTLVDEFNVNVSEDEEVAKPISISTDGINVYVLLNQQDRMLAIRITADAECQVDTEVTDTPLVPLYMSPASGAQIQIEGHVHPSARGIIHNIANVILSPDSDDNNLINNSAFDDTEILIQTDVEIIKTGQVDAVAGEYIEYQLLLSNAGPSDALDVNVIDLLPVGILNATWSCSSTGRSLCNNTTGSGSIDELVNVTIDGAINFTVSALIDPGFSGDITNSAEAVVIEFGNNTDTDLSNNISGVTTSVIQVADLSVVKSNATNEVVAGELTQYQIVVENAGPSDGQSIVIDMMPSELESVTWHCTAGTGSSCTANGQNHINDTVYVAVNSQLTYLVEGMVSSAAEGQLINEVMIDPMPPFTDSDLMNNISSDTDGIIQIADLSVSLEDLIDPYDPASPHDLPFKLEVVNLGPSDSRNVLVNLPLQLDVTADTVNICEVSASGVNCEIGYSAAGDVHEYIVNYRLNPSLSGTIDNLAEATADTFDPDLNNNIATTMTTLASGVDVRVSQSNGLEEAEPGQTLIYEIWVENIGSVDAGEITIDEQLPTGLIDASWQCEAFDEAVCLNIDAIGVTGGADLPSGGRVLLTLTATVDPTLDDMSQTEISNTVEALLVTETDYNLLNNSSTHTTPLVFFIFRDGFDGVTP